MIRIKRVYEPAGEDDGLRVLVDRLWPRGLTKEKAKVDLWLKEIAPSDPLRRWFAHEPARWEAFQRKYLEELGGKKELALELMSKSGSGPVTLLYGAKDTERNQAVVLKGYLEALAKRPGKSGPSAKPDRMSDQALT